MEQPISHHVPPKVKSIVTELVQFAADEGVERAVDNAEGFQLTLQSLAEIGNDEERRMAVALLAEVSLAIKAILNIRVMSAATGHGVTSKPYRDAMAALK